jgi:hypothetical protein
MELELQQAWRNMHFNWPQRRSMIVRANTEVARLARGVGKTQGIISPRVVHNAFAMPRSLGGFVVPSWKKMYQDLWPALMAGIESLGYVEGKHFVMGKRGDKRWEQPYHRQRDWSNTLHWSCGSARTFLSQYNDTIGNGLSLDDIVAEEAKQLDSEHFYSSIIPAMRGNLDRFGHLAEHHSLLIVSDAGNTSASRWFEAYKKSMDPELINLIFLAAHRQQTLIDRIESGGLATSTAVRYEQEINSLDRDLNEMRKHAVYYHEASILDNIDIYGWDNLLRKEASMDPRLFASSLMNETVDVVEGAWYNGLDEKKHCYIPQHTSFTTSRGWDRAHLTSKDSRHDAEVVTNQPLDIAFDYGGKFNCMAVGQPFSDTYRIDHGFHGTHPEIFADVLHKFIEYFRHHHAKSVNYFYDDTAKDKHGTTRYTYHDTVISTLNENGWDINQIYIGKTPSPELRYEMTAHLLGLPSPAPVQWNPDNCSDMLTSLRLTQIQEGPNGIRKNKRPEGRPLEEQVHAPHYGDAVDTLLWGRFQIMEQRSLLPAFSLR